MNLYDTLAHIPHNEDLNIWVPVRNSCTFKTMVETTGMHGCTYAMNRFHPILSLAEVDTIEFSLFHGRMSIELRPTWQTFPEDQYLLYCATILCLWRMQGAKLLEETPHDVYEAPFSGFLDDTATTEQVLDFMKSLGVKGVDPEAHTMTF